MHHWYLREAKSLGVGFAAVKLTLFHQNFHSHFCSEAPTTTKTTVTDCTLTHIKYIATLSANLRNHDSPEEIERDRDTRMDSPFMSQLKKLYRGGVGGWSVGE